MPFDSELIGAIHIERLTRRRAADDAGLLHDVFQTSTIDALLEGRFEGDMTFAELATHGDLGLGTVQQLDGEMIALDGRFWRADAAGHVTEVSAETRTPFAVLARFDPEIERTIDEPLHLGDLCAEIDALVPGSECVAFRLDGRFGSLNLRSVPRQEPPYKTLAEVLAEQSRYDVHEVGGTLVGFRFPRATQGLEVAGYHLHFLSADRRRGGHVLDADGLGGHLRLDHSSELHLELPAGVSFVAPDPQGAKQELLRRLEGGEPGPA